MGMNVARDSNTTNASGYAWLPPFVATVFYLMINGMHWRELNPENVSVPSVATKARLFLLFSLFVAISAIIGAAFVFNDKFVKVEGAYLWAGQSCLVSTCVIVAAGFVQRFGTFPPPKYAPNY